MSEPPGHAALPDVPPELVEAMGPAASSADPEELARAAFALLERVAEGECTRDDALALLAADALLTRAFEKLALHDPGALPAAAERWGAAGSIGRLAAGVGR